LAKIEGRERKVGITGGKRLARAQSLGEKKRELSLFAAEEGTPGAQGRRS